MHSHRRSRSLFMLVICTAMMLPMFGSPAMAQEETGSVDPLRVNPRLVRRSTIEREA